MNKEDIVPGLVLGNKKSEYDVLVLGFDEAEKNVILLKLGYAFPSIAGIHIENLLSSNITIKNGKTAIMTIFEGSKRLTDQNYKKIIKYLS